MDQIELRGLRVRGRHGVLAFERRDGQDFLVDAVLSVDTRPAAATDDLTLTVDYGTLSERLAQIVAGEPVQLIETLAERLASACLDEPAVQRVRITVHKPQAPISLPFSDVAVTITRDRPVQAVLALGSNLGRPAGRRCSRPSTSWPPPPACGSPRSRRSTRPTRWAARNSPTT